MLFRSEDIFTWSEDGEIVPGPYYKQWWKFRSQIIRDFIAKVKEYKDSVKPEVSLEYWAASWLHGLYRQGQNWAAPGAPYYREYCDSWASEDYGQTGFADQLDVFISGTYLERVRGLDAYEPTILHLPSTSLRERARPYSMDSLSSRPRTLSR